MSILTASLPFYKSLFYLTVVRLAAATSSTITAHLFPGFISTNPCLRCRVSYSIHCKAIRIETFQQAVLVGSVEVLFLLPPSTKSSVAPPLPIMSFLSIAHCNGASSEIPSHTFWKTWNHFEDMNDCLCPRRMFMHPAFISDHQNRPSPITFWHHARL
jgi:hypothetical protein